MGLRLACDCAALNWVQIPNSGFRGQTLDADLTFFLATRFSRPHHAKWRLFVIELEVDDLARLDYALHALKQSAITANVPHSHHLRKRPSFRVHAPNPHR
jgi:hypothetical protein